jgi:hypothetical protein
MNWVSESYTLRAVPAPCEQGLPRLVQRCWGEGDTAREPGRVTEVVLHDEEEGRGRVRLRGQREDGVFRGVDGERRETGAAGYPGIGVNPVGAG